MEWSRWQMLLSRCYGQITMVDEAVGSVIEKLRELQMDENTLIIWTADHGDALACHGGHFDKAFYLPEEVLRIPLAMACPGVLPKNRICRELVTNCDLAPTIVSAAGGAFRSPVDGYTPAVHGAEAGLEDGAPGRDLRTPCAVEGGSSRMAAV